MAEALRELRIAKGIPAKDMVAVVRAMYPKYDKTTQSKCESGEVYGVSIRPDAMQALYERFAPECLEPPKRTRHGQHRLTCRVSGRLANDTYAALQQYMRADGYATTQEWVTAMALRYIAEKEVNDPCTTP